MNFVFNGRDDGGQGKKLLEQMRDLMRLKHYSLRTEQTYCHWGGAFHPLPPHMFNRPCPETIRKLENARALIPTVAPSSVEGRETPERPSDTFRRALLCL